MNNDVNNMIKDLLKNDASSSKWEEENKDFVIACEQYSDKFGNLPEPGFGVPRITVESLIDAVTTGVEIKYIPPENDEIY